MPKTIMIPLDRIKNKFDVRTKLDDDRVLQLAGAYESGDELPPIKVILIDDDLYAYVNGRHRGAARALLNMPDIQAVVLTNSDPLEVYTEALRSNYGGAKPPTREDIAHTVTRMMEMGITQTSIKESLCFLPKRSIELYIAWAKGVLHKRRITGALDAIAEGKTYAEAAGMFKLKPETVKDAIKGKKGKWGNRSDEQQIANELKTYISKQLRSANSGIAKKMEEILKAVDNGEMSSKTASGVINAWQEHLRKTQIRINDWLARVDALSINRDRLVQGDHE